MDRWKSMKIENLFHRRNLLVIDHHHYAGMDEKGSIGSVLDFQRHVQKILDTADAADSTQLIGNSGLLARCDVRVLDKGAGYGFAHSQVLELLPVERAE